MRNFSQSGMFYFVDLHKQEFVASHFVSRTFKLHTDITSAGTLTVQTLSVMTLLCNFDGSNEGVCSHILHGCFSKFVAGLLESYSASAGEGYGVTCPPSLLIHRPACTLEHWLSNARAEATTPAFSDKASLCCGLCHVHPQGICVARQAYGWSFVTTF